MPNAATRLLPRVPNPTISPALHALLRLTDTGVGSLPDTGRDANDFLALLRNVLTESHPVYRECARALGNELQAEAKRG